MCYGTSLTQELQISLAYGKLAHTFNRPKILKIDPTFFKAPRICYRRMFNREAKIAPQLK